MYTPKHFAVNDRKEIIRFIHANGFGQIISLHEGRLFSSHIPFLLSHDGNKLHAHIAKANSQWRDIEGQEIMVTFEGAHDYISPSWYLSKGNPPTWNYQAAHVYGECAVFHDTEKIKEVLHELTAKHESGFAAPWQLKYNESMLRGIVGLEITVNDIQCKYKLSQNRAEQDRLSVINKLPEMTINRLHKAMKYNNK